MTLYATFIEAPLAEARSCLQCPDVMKHCRFLWAEILPFYNMA